MSSPYTQAIGSGMFVRCTDGGANDNKLTELTCTTTGALNCNIVSGTFTPAAAGAPTYGSVAVTNSAAALGSSTSFATSLTLYPDPSTDVYVGSTSGVTAATGPGNAILRAAGAPLVIQGPINLDAVFVICTGSAVVSYVGQ